jgi:hypothetical protein
LDRCFFEPFGKIIELALNPPSLDPPIDQGRDARRIIASIFETPEPFKQARRNHLLPYDANNSAHLISFFINSGSPDSDPGVPASCQAAITTNPARARTSH